MLNGALVLLLLLTVPAVRLAVGSDTVANSRLEHAARSNDVAAARAAIQDGADLNARGGGGQTPIMAATLAGSTDIVNFLLHEHSSDVDLSIAEKDGYTPMHGAGFQGRADIGRLLIKAGLNPSDRHQDGYTPIHRACWGPRQRHTEMVHALLDAGKVDVNELANGMTPLDSALRSGNRGTIELLKSRGGKTAEELKQQQAAGSIGHDDEL